jgi:putative sugar O-methyltransferase
MKTSISDYNEYKQVCLRASENNDVFNNFKKNSAYTTILEHASPQQGEAYLQYILKSDLNLSYIDKFKENDSQGGAVVSNYQEPFGLISPSTLRYIKVLAELKNLFGSLDNFTICEIGVGYGGQAKMIMDYFKVKEYNFVDLPETLKLTERYLRKFNYENLNYYTSDTLPEKKYDLVISNYAFTECTKSIQDVYLEKIINHSEKGYITCNHISDLFEISSYSKEELLTLLKDSKEKPEEPITFNNNYILYW